MPEKPLVLPPMRRTVSEAAAFARKAYEGRVDKLGVPYWSHLRRVAKDATRGLIRLGYHSDAPEYDLVEQTGWLHDVLEDTDYTAEDLLREGFSRDVVMAVHNLSNLAGLPYPVFVQSIVDTGHLPTILVKIADVEDNLDPDRLALLPEDVQARLRRKYEPALVVLKEAAARLGKKEMADV